jgi:hypothetical protein
LATFTNQFLQPGIIDDKFLKEVFFSHISGFIEDCLKGILFVSADMTSVGSGLPIGPRKKLSGWPARGIMILFLSS